MLELSPAELLAPETKEIWVAADTLEEPTPADIIRLRRIAPDLPTDLVSAVITQVQLRRKARSSLGDVANRMLFTATGLQQSTPPATASRRARRLVDLGLTSVLDVGCGIGVDAMASQRAGLTVTAIEKDPVTAAFATVNLEQQVRNDDAVVGTLPLCDATFFDPARRSQNRRLMSPDDWSPSWSWITKYGEGRPRTVAKAAPGIPHDRIPARCAAEWVSLDHRLIETCIWFEGLAAGLPRRSAVLLHQQSDPWKVGEESVLGTDDESQPAPLGPVADWILEPDPAIIRSHLIDTLAERIGAVGLSSDIAYLTSNHPPDPSWAQRLKVLDEVPAGGKALRLELRRREIGKVEIHTRGLGIDPTRLRRSLKLSGSGPLHHLLLTRVAGTPTGFLVQPDSPKSKIGS